MAFSLIWLPEVLRNAGLKVAETDGWTTRGRGEMRQVRGVMLHHTGSKATGNMPTLSTLKNGRSDLPGPLCQLGLGYDGTFYVVAAGRANHAGAGSWRGIETGNTSFIGIEAENPGHGEAWPDVQMDAYRRGVVALLRRIGAGPEMCCGHKEYARPKGRKPDPMFDMDVFRHEVDEILRSVGAVRQQIPASDGERPTLRRGDRGELVETVQTQVLAPVDGRFGPVTEARVRQFQRREGIVPDGIVGPVTWERILNQPGTGPSAQTSETKPNRFGAHSNGAVASDSHAS